MLSTFRVPSTSKLSVTLTVPPAESRIRFPDVVSISESPESPILISLICASENANVALPSGAPSSESGKNPFDAVTTPATFTPVRVVFSLRVLS